MELEGGRFPHSDFLGCEGRIRTCTRWLDISLQNMLYPHPPPPRPEGMAACFITSQCFVYVEVFITPFAVRAGFEPARGG